MTLVQDSKVLIVGAGGIGCELLKTAVLSNFSNIHIVDLDTIELSNLNRQFLFRRQHIGQSKALIAKEAALKMIPSASITAHFADITNTQIFSISFFKSFDLVMNALDNLGARRYVNQMCLMANVPLIESGTAGYLGQTSVIINRKTECFDCNPKEAPKTFPVCTIRSTPTSPIHCIIWAKEFLFPNLFGLGDYSAEVEESNEVLKDTWSSEQAAFESLKSLKGKPEEYYEKLAKKLFIQDIEKIKGIDELWKDRSRPVALNEEDLIMKAELIESYDNLNDHQVWDLSVIINNFKTSIFKLLSRPSNVITFDKDDQDTLDLVLSAANLRATVFGIENKSKFDVKAMAGNIIPAIATTNAIAAGMIIIHAKNILQGLDDNLCNAYINYGTSRNVFSIERVCKPNPDCSVCSCDRALITVDVDSFTIKGLLDHVIPLYLNELGSKYPEMDIQEFDEDDISVLEGSRLLYDIEDDNDNGNKPLSSLGISDSKLIKIDLSPRRPLILGILNDQNRKFVDLKFDLIEPRTLKRKLEESDNPEQSEDELLVCIHEKDDSIEIIEKSVKKAKIASDNLT